MNICSWTFHVGYLWLRFGLSANVVSSILRNVSHVFAVLFMQVQKLNLANEIIALMKRTQEH